MKWLPDSLVRVKSYPLHPDNDPTILRFRDIEDISHITLTLEPSMRKKSFDAGGDFQLTMQIKSETRYMHNFKHPQ